MFFAVVGDELQPEVPLPQAVLVCGVDVDGSTALKISNPYGAVGISNFMSSFDSKLRDLDLNDGDCVKNGWYLWRVRGDELVYFRIIPVDRNGELDYGVVREYVEQFIKAMEYKYKIADDILGLHGYSFLLHNREGYREFWWNLMERNPGSKKNIQIIHGNWERDSAREEITQDIFSKYKNSLHDIQREYFIDFMGRSVDLGFRIAEYSRPHYFVVSPSLARCILKGSGHGDAQILFLGLHELKGCSLGEDGPERFPLCFLPVKSKGKDMDQKNLANYKRFNVEKLKNVLTEFVKYEKESIIAMYNKSALKSDPVRSNDDVAKTKIEEINKTLEAVMRALSTHIQESTDSRNEIYQHTVMEYMKNIEKKRSNLLQNRKYRSED